MMTKCVFFFVAAFLFSTSSAGVLPLASYAVGVGPVASSYSAHTVHHAVASPVVAHAPLIAAAPAPLVAAAPAPLLAAAHAPVVAAAHAAPLLAAPSPFAYSSYPYPLLG